MINVIGLGYIGLPTALMLAAHGNRVVGTDLNASLVDTLRRGALTFEEEQLPELFEAAVKKGIAFQTEYAEAEVYVVAVPTPYDARTRKVDASYVARAVETIAQVCPPGAVIVIESTISPGTVDASVRPALAACGRAAGRDIHLAHAPERIIPGAMVRELRDNARVVGADSPEIGRKVKAIYQTFCRGEIVVTDIRSAEMVKVAENTFRDINIAYANELAKICRIAGMDVYEIIRIANMHPRVNILRPGPGVGGHCISVDPWFLVGDYPGLANIILAARKINDSMPEFVLARTREIMAENRITDIARVGFYGLTYKENVDDTRESPTLQALEIMREHLCDPAVQVYDPFVKKDIVPHQHHDLDAFLSASDLVVVFVGHEEILRNAGKLRGKVVFDTRNCLPEVAGYRL